MIDNGTNPIKPRTSRGPLWPWLLILAGVLLVLTNLGWLNWLTIADYAMLLPLVLVALGLDMILKGRHRLLVVGGTVVVGALLMGAGPRWVSGPFPSMETVSQELQGARRAEVSLATGVSRLTVTGSARSDLLVEGDIQPRRGERVDTSFSVRGGTARYTATSTSRAFGGMFGARGGNWDLLLSGRVPLVLNVDTGVGDSRLELSGIDLERLSVNTGVGSATITLPDSGRFEADIDTGVGSATIQLPRGLAARIVVDKGIGSVRVPPSFTRDGDVYVSPDYATATDRVEIKIDSGVGDVDIVLIN